MDKSTKSSCHVKYPTEKDRVGALLRGCLDSSWIPWIPTSSWVSGFPIRGTNRSSEVLLAARSMDFARPPATRRGRPSLVCEGSEPTRFLSRRPPPRETILCMTSFRVRKRVPVLLQESLRHRDPSDTRARRGGRRHLVGANRRTGHCAVSDPFPNCQIRGGVTQ